MPHQKQHVTSNRCLMTDYVTYIKTQWRIQEFQIQEARSRHGKILRSGVCFDANSHIPYVFVAK